MIPGSRTGSAFNPATASPEDVIAVLLALYDKDVFNEYDTNILTQICELVLEKGVVNDRQVSLVRSKLKRYWRDIPSLDLKKYRTDFKVQTFVAAAGVRPSVGELKSSCYDKETIRLDFGYDESVLNRIKAIPGRFFHNQGREKYWTVPVSPINIKTLTNIGFPIPKEFQYVTKSYDFELDFDGLKMQLRPYQIQGVEMAAGTFNGRALLADEMGLGKTPQALATAWVRRDELFPALVMCPGSLKWNWVKEANMWLPGVGVRILEGFTTRTSYRTRQKREITIVNWDILADRGKRAGWARLLKDTGFQYAILDECQDIKNMKTKRTEAVMNICENIPYILGLSGTPIESRPAEFFPILSIVAPELFPNWYAFATRYCGEKDENGFNTFKGASNTKELNEILTDRIMIRRRKADVLKDLPPKTRQVITVGINMSEYQRAEDDLRSFLQKSKGEPPQERSAGGLTRIERCKQAAARGKLKDAIEYIENYLSSGRKLVVFAVHVFVIDALEKHFSGQCVRMDGKVTGIKRQHAVDAFQGDDKIRLFIGTIKPAGRGHTLTAAADTLTLEFEWAPGKHDQAEDRVHRIGQEAKSVHAYYMIAKGTIEEDIMELIDTKRDILSQVLDGKEAEQEGMLKYLINKYGG